MSPELSLEKIKETLNSLVEVSKKNPKAIALIGAGSAGAQSNRMDKYSDIDFFLVVEDGSSREFIDDNSWFSDVLPIAFAFRDTDHGNKALLENGVFFEFAIFTEAELALYGIPGLKVHWAREGFVLPDFPLTKVAPADREISYYVDQALSNLYVGALRMNRGERLAALAMIERYALNNLLTAYRIKNSIPLEDPFNIERRAEISLGVDFSRLVFGYENLSKSLIAILQFAEENFMVNKSVAKAIRALNAN